MTRRRRYPSTTLARVAALWSQGMSQVQIAAALSLPVNTAGSYIGRARLVLGAQAVPHRVRGCKVGQNRVPTPLDRLRAVGDSVIVPKAGAGTRQNVHQNAETRGWKVRMRSVGETWVVTALAAADKAGRE